MSQHDITNLNEIQTVTALNTSQLQAVNNAKLQNTQYKNAQTLQFTKGTPG